MSCNKCIYLQKNKYKDTKGIVYPFREYGCSKLGSIPLGIPIVNCVPEDKYLKGCGCSDFKEQLKQMTIFDFIQEVIK